MTAQCEIISSRKRVTFLHKVGSFITETCFTTRLPEMDKIETLISLIQAGSTSLTERHEAFGELVKRFQDMAYGYAYALLEDGVMAQDAAQEAFIVAYQNLNQLQEPAAFPGWLRRIVLSQCHRLIRKKQAPIQALELAAEPVSIQPEPTAIVETQELRDRVQTAIRQLPESQRVAAILFYIDGYSQQEVAAFMELSVEAVKKRLQRARQQLKERMIDMVQEDLRNSRPSKDEKFLQTVQLSTTLEGAAMEGQLNTIELLLIDGLDVNARGKDGQTLLHWAAQRGHLEAAELLLKSGGNSNLKDKSGRTPLQLAEEGGYGDVVKLLKEKKS
jgi:RNA polymerase sigma factor (sigma-70 family)